jgi:drug/metabolite transporter (DMT)-like permease
MQGAGLSLRPFLENLTKTPLPYIFALSCAFLWAFYSVLSNKFSEKNSLSGVPIFLLASGLALGICRLLFPEQSEWDIRTILEFVSYVVFTIIFGYSFWDFAMRKGNIVLVTALSYFIPLSSTILSSVYLKVPLTASLWAGSIMIILGALLCSLSVKDPN